MENLESIQGLSWIPPTVWKEWPPKTRGLRRPSHAGCLLGKCRQDLIVSPQATRAGGRMGPSQQQTHGSQSNLNAWTVHGPRERDGKTCPSLAFPGQLLQDKED